MIYKKLIPSSLLGRSLIIVFVPIITIMILTTFIFYKTSWNIISKRLTQSVVADINLNFGKSGFHAGEAIDVLEPICVGDKLDASIQLSDVYVKTGRSGQMVFIVWEHIFRNQNGNIAAKVRESHVRRE